MPFVIVRNNIVKVKADAIVNSANPLPVYGSGTDRAVYEAAGKEKLLEERKKIGTLLPGQAAATPAFALNAKYIIHTVGPLWAGGEQGEYEDLTACYRNSLELAKSLKCKSIAFPLISTGVYGFPKDKALRIAIDGKGYTPDIWCNPANAVPALCNVLKKNGMIDDATIQALTAGGMK